MRLNSSTMSAAHLNSRLNLIRKDVNFCTAKAIKEKTLRGNTVIVTKQVFERMARRAHKYNAHADRLGLRRMDAPSKTPQYPKEMGWYLITNRYAVYVNTVE